MAVSSSKLERLGGGALFDALRVAADRCRLGLALAFLDSDPPHLVFLNDYPTEMLGYSQDELDRRGLWSLAVPEELPRFRGYLTDLRNRANVPTSFETVVVTKSGVELPIQVTLSEVELDGGHSVIVFFSDVSERRVAISALQESEARFRSVVEGAPDGVAILRGQQILFLNPRAARMLGLSSPEAGKGRLISEFLEPDDAELAELRIGELLASGRVHRDPAEYRSKSADGEQLVVEISSIPIDLGGERSVLAFARDITERKAIQARLAEAERLTALGVLSAGVAHEINNPLAYVLLNLEYLRQQLPRLAEDPARLSDLMVRVRDACHGAERVATIVRDLRTFARGDDGTRGPVDLREVIEAAINIAGNTLKQSARIVRDYGESPLVDASANRLEQVFLNLLLNAAQALPNGDPERDEIRIRLYGDQLRAVAEIVDTGPGIPEPVIGRIFEPFFTTKPVGVGTGLGLPICRSILAAHSGTIEVESKPNEGATFRIILPASSTGRGAVRRTSSRPLVTLGPRGRVLVVDDEVAVGSTLRLVLQREHDVQLATSGEEALRLIATGTQFHAIVCDLMMPGMTGADLYEAIRAAHPGLEQRMVFMTGGALLAKTEEFMSRVKNPLLEKPFDVPLVRRTLEKLVAAGS
ncbi:MAG: PAS domain S-box protein [Myxococcota bacterium]|nr:PAS domain S-box protein [Myxococcota bacterium]